MKKIRDKIFGIWENTLIIKLRLALLIAIILLCFTLFPTLAYHFYMEYRFWQDYGLQMQEDLVAEQGLTSRLTTIIEQHCLSPRGLDENDWVSYEKGKDRLGKDNTSPKKNKVKK